MREGDALGDLFRSSSHPPIERLIGYYRELLPAWPPVAYLLRRCAYLEDALRLWASQPIEDPLSGLDPDVRKQYESGMDLFGHTPAVIKRFLRAPIGDPRGRAWRNTVAVAVIEAASTCRHNFEATLAATKRMRAPEHVRKQWDDDDPRKYGADEIRDVVEPLVVAYLNPSLFFGETLKNFAPAISGDVIPLPEDAVSRIKEIHRENGLSEQESDAIIEERPLRLLLEHVWTWGSGLLLWHRDARTAFEALSGPRQAGVLSVLERRPEYREGRPQGRKDSKPRPPKVDLRERLHRVYEEAERWSGETWAEKGAVKEGVRRVAERDSVATETIRSSIKRAKAPRKKSG